MRCSVNMLAVASILVVPSAITAEEPARPRRTVRLAATQPRARIIDYRLEKPSEVLARVDASLGELEALADKAGEARCDALAFPEDTLGLLQWSGVHTRSAKEVLPEAVKRLLERFGRKAAQHRMYIVVSSDCIEKDGATYNTAFLLGRDGKEIGRYHKVNLAYAEQTRRRGKEFPVFDTPDLGTLGMLICYDMVMPEASRCLALAGADVIFHPTLGGAAIGDDDISLAAFRTRAVDNFVYVVVAQRGSGSMIISPQGKVLAKAEGLDSIVHADIDPHGGREGSDATGQQDDMRARLFRERSPEAFGILTDPNPPILKKAPIHLTPQEAADIGARALTFGEDDFKAADALARSGKAEDAAAAYEALRKRYPGTWIDRVSAERLAAAGHGAPVVAAPGIAAKYPGDGGIERDPDVIFAEDFESDSVEAVAKRWTEAKGKDRNVMALVNDSPPGSRGKQSLQVTATLGENDGGHLYRRLPEGFEMLYARFYVKFAEDSGYTHHFVALGGYNPPTNWPQGGAGERPRGDDRIYIGIEPNGNHGTSKPPGAWAFYNYWHEMKISADGKFWGNAIQPEAPLQVPRDRWQCVEVMAKLNTPPEGDDGALALWIDGVEVLRVGKGTPRAQWSGMGFKVLKKGGEPFEGFRWRSNAELKLNFFWLLHYVTENAPRQNGVSSPPRKTRVSFDHIVVARRYVGPISP